MINYESTGRRRCACNCSHETSSYITTADIYPGTDSTTSSCWCDCWDDDAYYTSTAEAPHQDVDDFEEESCFDLYIIRTVLYIQLLLQQYVEQIARAPPMTI